MVTEDDHVLEPAGERDEKPAERLDRNWAELLQELRVTQTGIQLLSGFLLTLPFQPRFADLDPALVLVFLAAVASGTLATALVIAPAMAHRLLFRRHLKDRLVASGDLLAKTGLGCLALTVVLAVTLIYGVVSGVPAGLIAGGVCLAGFALLWLVLPARLARAPRKSRYR